MSTSCTSLINSQLGLDSARSPGDVGRSVVITVGCALEVVLAAMLFALRWRRASSEDLGSRLRSMLTRVIVTGLIGLGTTLFGGKRGGAVPGLVQTRASGGLVPRALAAGGYAADGTSMGKYYTVKGNRLDVSFKDISPNVIHALVSTEDVRFYDHSGVDAKAVLQALDLHADSRLGPVQRCGRARERALVGDRHEGL